MTTRNIAIKYPSHGHGHGRDQERGQKRGHDPGVFTKIVEFIARFWTEADKRVGDNMKYWR